MIDIEMITVEGCVHCASTKKVFEELKSEYPQMKITEIDATSEKGMVLVAEHGIFQSPGILINGELFSTGGLNKKKFIKKLEELKK